MCLMLYIATSVPLDERALLNGFAVQSVPSDRLVGAGAAFSLPHVHFVGQRGSCSCGLPHMLCDQVIEYYEGMFKPGPERQAAVDLVQDLLVLVREALQSGEVVELLALWSGAEGLPPAGRIELRASSIKADEFFFIEQFLYVVAA